MLFFWRTIYAIAIKLYGLIIHFASLFKPKAKAWVDGRTRIYEELKRLDKDKETIWMHAASLGEFEQGWPLVEELKAKRPNMQVLVTFYSPSGYEVIKPKGYADVVTYMPLDTPLNAIKFIQTVKPSIALFIKYEFWFFHLKELYEHNIPTYLVSAHFVPESIFFSWYGQLHRSMLNYFTQLFVQKESSKALLSTIESEEKTIVAGDTRLDRVLKISQTTFQDEHIEQFVEGHKTMVAGSTWTADESHLAEYFNKKGVEDWRLIIAPHEVSKARINQIQSTFSGVCVLHSELNEANGQNKVLIIDSIGILNKIYRYAHIAYVGGGFGKGIHNLLEPIAYKVPVLFGPNHERFQEAEDLLEAQVARVVKNGNDLKEAISYFDIEDNRAKAKDSIQQYIDANAGAAKKMAEIISKKIV